MSRYVVEDTGLREVVVGWDPPLGTFFGQIFGAGEDDDCIWWAGDGRHAIPSLHELEKSLRGVGVTLDEETRAQLLADQQAPWEPGAQQRRFGFTG